jgi:hypothetical protein
MKTLIGLGLLVLAATIALGCNGGGGTSLVTGANTSKENLPQAPAVPSPE